MEDFNRPEELTFYKEIIDRYNEVLAGIDYLVVGTLTFTEADDPRRLKLEKFLDTLKTKMDVIIRNSKVRYEINQEIERRMDALKIELACDKCGSAVEDRVGIMKWHDGNKPTPEDWILLEKFNDFLGIPVRWVTYCTNPKCGKIWKEGEFSAQVSAPIYKSMMDKIEIDVLRERGMK